MPACNDAWKQIAVYVCAQWVGCYISNELNYKRNLALEGVDSNLIIIDIEGTNPTRIINLYRSFNPQNGVSQRGKFKHQLSLIKESFTNKKILLGDFNLDYRKKNIALIMQTETCSRILMSHCPNCTIYLWQRCLLNVRNNTIFFIKIRYFLHSHQ